MIPTLVNLRTHKGPVHWIDRSSRILGNPFSIGPNCTREQSVDLFQDYFDKNIKESPSFRQAVLDLRNHEFIGCWCTPLLCHGDIYIRYLKEIEDESDVAPAEDEGCV